MSGIIDSDFLAAIDGIRGIPDELGVAPFTVTVRVISYAGGRPGQPGAVRTVVDTPIRVGNGQRSPRVSQLTTKDIVASGGLYSAADLKMGPITPPHVGGGHSTATIDPDTTSASAEVFYVLTGPGIPAGGTLFQRIGDDTVSTTQYFVVLRSTGRPATPP